MAPRWLSATISRPFPRPFSKTMLGIIVFTILLALMSVILAKIFSDLAFADERLPSTGVSHFVVQTLESLQILN